MKKILLKILLCVLFSSSILFCLTACNNGQPSIKGTEIYSETLTVDNQAKTVYGKLPNVTESYEGSKNIRVAEDATYHLCSDILGQNAIVSKTAVLETGDNVYYLIVENNNEIETYTLTLRVKPLYKVSFDIQPECFISKNTSSNDNPGVIIGGSSLISIVDTQLVEDDAVAVVPEQPTRLGCEFTRWDFDFSQKISTDITIKAKWKRNAEMINFEFKSDNSRCEITNIRNSDITQLIIPEYVTSFSISSSSCFYKLVEIINKSPKLTIGSLRGSSPLAIFNSDDVYENKFTNDNGYIIYNNGLEKILCRYEGTDTELILPNYITSIHNYAFYGNSNMISVIIPKNVETVKGYAFFMCKTLKWIVIENNLLDMGRWSFQSCSSLNEVYYKGTVEEWQNIYHPDNLGYIKRYFYSENEPTLAGNYWHYVNGVPTIWPNMDN